MAKRQGISTACSIRPTQYNALSGLVRVCHEIFCGGNRESRSVYESFDHRFTFSFLVGEKAEKYGVGSHFIGYFRNRHCYLSFAERQSHDNYRHCIVADKYDHRIRRQCLLHLCSMEIVKSFDQWLAGDAWRDIFTSGNDFIQ